MPFNIREFVGNANDPDLKEMYDCVNDLVNIAGDVRIEDLFRKSRRELGDRVWKAIQDAKSFGFLAMQNNSCCLNGNCLPSAKGWCSKTKSGDCSAASSVCGSSSATQTFTASSGVEHLRNRIPEPR